MLTTEDLRGRKKEEIFPWNALIHSFKRRWIYLQIIKSKLQCLLHQSLKAFRKNSSNVFAVTVKHSCKDFKVNYCPIILLKKWHQNSISFRPHLTLSDLWFSTWESGKCLTWSKNKHKLKIKKIQFLVFFLINPTTFILEHKDQYASEKENICIKIVSKKITLFLHFPKWYLLVTKQLIQIFECLYLPLNWHSNLLNKLYFFMIILRCIPTGKTRDAWRKNY